MTDDSGKGKDKEKSKKDEDSGVQPMNKRTPGNKGRNWRGDSTDLSEDTKIQNKNVES